GEQENVNTDLAIQDRSEIPEQIKTFLKSPFVPDVPDKTNDTHQTIKEILLSGEKIKEISAHINYLVEKHVQRNSSLDDEELKVSISSTRSIGETLIIGEMDGGSFHLRNDDLRQAMKEKSWQTFHRVQAEKTGTDLYKLFKNSEMLVGNEHVTQEDDIQHFYDSFSETHHPEYSDLTNEKVKTYCDRIQREGVSLNNKKLAVSVKYHYEEKRQSLAFEFEESFL
ncbi:MAG: hypothetical protein GY786_19570, partial [Proteobacteria bacterium]|nr:hypothetical protein [Pseudomonadota bacterium]